MPEKRNHDSPPEPEEQLIAAAERDASELVVARALRQPVPDAVPGYRILREIGRGGMGVVYEAQQERPPRRVALKMVRGGGCADAHRLKLFEREARTLARLQHPGLAAIYEGGQTRDGYPFYAMELVSGVPLVRCAREQGLALGQRLDLFCQVCEAVAYAHQRGVIHRDLKPSNILVTADGRPKILDFGLARLTQDDSDLVTTCTLSANVAGTLAYMSPEQACSFPEGVDIRTDVYSLGVTLYELVTGKLPYDLPTSLSPNAVRTICDQTPRKPSTVDRRLRGEVETIILKALEKEPGRRYQSAGALSEDIHRYLTGHTILAHPPSTVYQLRKLATRHKLPVALAGTLLTVTAGFAVLGTIQAQRITEQRDRIAAERDRAVTAEAKAARETERVTSNNEFYRELLRGVGLSVSASSNLQGPLSRAEAVSLLNRLAGQVESAFQEDTELRADAHASLATGFLSLRMWPEAEAHVRLALVCRGQAFGLTDPRYFNTLIDLGRLLQEQSRNKEASEAFRAGLDGLCATVGEEHPDAIRAARQLAWSMTLQQRFEEAEALFRRIRQLQRDMPGGDLSERLWTTRGLARMLMRTGRLQEGEQLAREVIQTAAHATGRDAGLVFSSGVATLAEALGQQGRYRRAHELMQQEVAITRRLDGDLDPGVEHFRAASARYLWQMGDPRPAEATLWEILAGQRSALGLSSGYTRITMSFLGRLLNAAGRFAEAEAICLEGVRASERYEGLDNGISLTLMVALGTARHGLGYLDEAEAVFRHASEIFQRFPPLQDILVRIELERRYGRCLADLGRYAEAEALLLAAYQGEAQMRGEDHENTRDAVESLIALYEASGQADKAAEYRGLLTPAETVASATELAESLMREAGTAGEVIRHLESDPSLSEAVRTRALQHFHNHVQDTETSIAVYWWFLRSPDGDAATYQAALEQAREACRLEPGNGAYLRSLGAALYRVGAYEEALAALRRAEEANAPRPGESHPADVAFMAMAWQRLGRTEQASIELERLRALIQDARYAESEELQTLLGEAEAAGRSEP